VRKDYEPGVLAPSQKFASELAARDAFNREHPPLKGLVVPYDPRKMELPERPWRNSRGQWFDLAGWRWIWMSNGVCGHRHLLQARSILSLRRLTLRRRSSPAAAGEPASGRRRSSAR
jgi:hypothetical protein